MSNPSLLPEGLCVSIQYNWKFSIFDGRVFFGDYSMEVIMIKTGTAVKTIKRKIY